MAVASRISLLLIAKPEGDDSHSDLYHALPIQVWRIMRRNKQCLRSIPQQDLKLIDGNTHIRFLRAVADELRRHQIHPNKN